MEKKRVSVNQIALEDLLAQVVKQLPLITYNLRSIDKLWKITFPSVSRRKWYQLTLLGFDDKFTLSESIQYLETLTITNDGKIERHGSKWSLTIIDEVRNIKAWKNVLTDLMVWLSFVKKDWVAAHLLLLQHLPYKYRSGFMYEAIAQKYLIKEKLHFLRTPFKELKLTKAEINKFVKLVEGNYFYNQAKANLQKPTASLFFEYCRIAYLVTEARGDTSLKEMSGKELYKIFADNRHEGLLDIDENSDKIFAAWCNGDRKYRDMGGHPFEIIRGGGKDQLYLRAEKEYNGKEIRFHLAADTRFRLVEVVRIALAFYENNMPFTMSDPIGVRLCLLKQNKCAIVAQQDDNHSCRGNSEESEESIYNYYSIEHFGKKFSKVEPFITWKKLPILRYND
jgi:hypothetical protein